MAKNPGGSSGSSVRFVADGACVGGQWLKVGQYFGQVQADVADGEIGILQVEDILYGPIAAVDCAIGDAMYYDEETGKLTNAIGDGSLPFVGVAAEVIASATGYGLVRLNESGISPVLAFLVSEWSKQARGTVTIATGASAGTASVGTAFNAKPVLVNLQSTTGDGKIAAATPTARAVVAGGTLTLTLLDKDGAATVNAGSGNQVWSYFCDAR